MDYFFFISTFFQSWGRIWKREIIREEKLPNTYNETDCWKKMMIQQR